MVTLWGENSSPLLCGQKGGVWGKKEAGPSLTQGGKEERGFPWGGQRRGKAFHPTILKIQLSLRGKDDDRGPGV